MLAYLFPESKIKVSRTGHVTVTGLLALYQHRIAHFIKSLGLKKTTIRYYSGRFYFSGSIEAGMQQRLRNFFLAECPLTKR